LEIVLLKYLKLGDVFGDNPRVRGALIKGVGRKEKPFT